MKTQIANLRKAPTHRTDHLKVKLEIISKFFSETSPLKLIRHAHKSQEKAKITKKHTR